MKEVSFLVFFHSFKSGSSDVWFTYSFNFSAFVVYALQIELFEQIIQKIDHFFVELIDNIVEVANITE